MNIKKITKFASILAIITLVTGLFSCDRAQQIVKPGTSQIDISIPIQERDHIWVVDQNGVEVPVRGTWKLAVQTNPNSPFTIGESFTLPPEIPHKVLLSEGIYTDGEGILWTKGNITTDDDSQLMFLERVDTSVSPHQLHIVWKLTDDGSLSLVYGEYPFDVPGHDVQIWEKQ